MNNLKTVGVFDQHGKHYDITNTLSGETHRARREGSRFKLDDGFVGTLKQCKERVAANDVGEQEVIECVFCGTSKTCASCSGYRSKDGTWDSVHPAALLSILMAGRTDLIDEAFKNAATDALDCYGYLDERGAPDAERSVTELKIWLAKQSRAMGVDANVK